MYASQGLGKPAIVVENLKKTYIAGGIFQKQFEALKGIDFDVKEGEIFGLLGPNGAGKTTFIKVLLGIVSKSGGNATVYNEPAGSQNARRLIGYLPENLRLPSHLTGNTALELFGALNGLTTAEVREKRGPLLELVGIADRAADKVTTYSKGMRQRLGLAQALIHDPKVLVLDEPTDGLDPVARSQVRDLLVDLKNKGVTIFFNSHILQEVELICDRVAILHQGELQVVGSLDDVRNFLQSKNKGGESGIEVTLDLEGSKEIIENTIASGKIKELVQTAVNEFRAVVSFRDQAAVDAAVDKLRQQGVNIIGLSRRKVSLEDAFIKIISGAADKQ